MSDVITIGVGPGRGVDAGRLVARAAAREDRSFLRLPDRAGHFHGDNRLNAELGISGGKQHPGHVVANAEPMRAGAKRRERQAAVRDRGVLCQPGRAQRGRQTRQVLVVAEIIGIGTPSQPSTGFGLKNGTSMSRRNVCSRMLSASAP